jgi:hypothetical protein
MNYYCLLRARCLEHQPVVALNLLFELLPLRLRVGRAAYWCRLCPNTDQIKPQAAQVGNESFWSIGKGESKQAGASPRDVVSPSWTSRGHRSWLAGSLRVFDSLASRPAQLDGGREEATNVAFL